MVIKQQTTTKDKMKIQTTLNTESKMAWKMIRSPEENSYKRVEKKYEIMNDNGEINGNVVYISMNNAKSSIVAIETKNMDEKNYVKYRKFPKLLCEVKERNIEIQKFSILTDENYKKIKELIKLQRYCQNIEINKIIIRYAGCSCHKCETNKETCVFKKTRRFTIISYTK
ncbi:hypothetical protein RFI_26415 [Reticulomyxa filosa]|uniref:Uncharacterized protein n=1 Tax=Reticulomyxa filosa TaxID=46433 RepID=X6MBZ9_RETFI|nr:hypothetical protein RFI_26415 [Reticulomyxa filosa]|eukprot:ETO10962.1 hypothetical protein RFI_26415 [Reticulomyxa filosa]